MSSTAFIFPGQASQYVGMAKDFYESSEKVRDLFDKASDILEYNLRDVCFNGPLEKLTETQYTQPAILVHSLAILLEMGEDYERPAYVAGHSLGEYSALACAGVLSFEDAILAVRERSRQMQRACDQTGGTMAALIGCDGENLEKLIKDASSEGIIQPANYNSPGQVALSGDRKAIEKAIDIAKDYGARKAIPLKVGGAFHSPLMKSAQLELRNVLDTLDFKPAGIDVVTNVKARPETNPEELKNLLVEQITSPVLWRQTIEFMNDNAITRYVEIGPGKVLSGLVKRTAKDAEVINIDTVEDMKKFMEVAGA